MRGNCYQMLKHNGCIMFKVDWVRYREGRWEGGISQVEDILSCIHKALVWGIMRMWVVCVLRGIREGWGMGGREEGVMEC